MSNLFRAVKRLMQTGNIHDGNAMQEFNEAHESYKTIRKLNIGDLIYKQDWPSSVKLLLMYLYDYSITRKRDKGYSIHLAQGTIARHINVARQTVNRAMKHLVTLGLIKRWEHGIGKALTYQFIFTDLLRNWLKNTPPNPYCKQKQVSHSGTVYIPNNKNNKNNTNITSNDARGRSPNGAPHASSWGGEAQNPVPIAKPTYVEPPKAPIVAKEDAQQRMIEVMAMLGLKARAVT